MSPAPGLTSIVMVRVSRTITMDNDCFVSSEQFMGRKVWLVPWERFVQFLPSPTKGETMQISIQQTCQPNKYPARVILRVHYVQWLKGLRRKNDPIKPNAGI